MAPTKLYAPQDHYAPRERGQLIDLLKPFWGKGQDFDDAQRVAMYGISESEVAFTGTIEGCDWAVLPMSWNYYRQYRRMDQARELVQHAALADKKVLSWTSGDFGVSVPHYDNLTVLRCSGYRSRLPANHKGMPVFFGDPLKKFFGREEIVLREKQEKPVVGFCGQAKGHWCKNAFDLLRTAWRNTNYIMGLSFEAPQVLYPSTIRRTRILDILERDERISTNLIRRNHYRAGAQTPEARERSTREFFDNILHSDYIVCVRGGSNFSVRLYETLAMGRIQVVVNTDCLLPLADRVEWKQHVVWVESDEIPHIADMVMEFHQRLTPARFQDLQYKNRQLWNDKLRLGFFFKTLLSASH